jgi:hypothetical protein
MGKERHLSHPEREADMAEKITKQEAVRRALDHFGRDAKPSQMQGWIKQTFGVAMSTDHISTAKGSVLKQQADKGKPKGQKPAGPRPAAGQGPAGEAAGPPVPPTPASAIKGGGGKEAAIPLHDILYVKGLVGRFGADPLHTLIDAFAG